MAPHTSFRKERGKLPEVAPQETTERINPRDGQDSEENSVGFLIRKHLVFRGRFVYVGSEKVFLLLPFMSFMLFMVIIPFPDEKNSFDRICRKGEGVALSLSDWCGGNIAQRPLFIRVFREIRGSHL